MMRFALSEAQWAKLTPLLPPSKPPTGRPNKDHRLVVEAILWHLRTGAPWRDLPSQFGPWQSAYSRLRRWQAAGVWERVLAELQRQADADGRLDWVRHFVDSTVIRAHQHAAGARRGHAATEALGRSRGGFSSKLHLRAERGGKPIAVALTGGERHELPVLHDLLVGGTVRRRGPGRPRWRPEVIVGDKGYSSPEARRWLHAHRIVAVIPARADQLADPGFDRAAYRERNVVERIINRLKQWRGIATRYDKLAAVYCTHITIAVILLWL